LRSTIQVFYQKKSMKVISNSRHLSKESEHDEETKLHTANAEAIVWQGRGQPVTIYGSQVTAARSEECPPIRVFVAMLGRRGEVAIESICDSSSSSSSSSKTRIGQADRFPFPPCAMPFRLSHSDSLLWCVQFALCLPQSRYSLGACDYLSSEGNRSQAFCGFLAMIRESSQTSSAVVIVWCEHDEDAFHR
jgi:hypothetical protein